MQSDPTAPDSAPETEKDEPSDIDRVLEYIDPQIADLWHSSDGDTFVTRKVGKDELAALVPSMPTEAWLRRAYRERLGTTLRKHSREHLCDELAGRALEGELHRPRVRISGCEGSIVIDLGGEDGATVVIDGEGFGWRTRPATTDDRFIRPPGMLPLETPDSDGGGVDDLRALVNMEEHQFTMLLAWMLTALRPMRPWPMLRTSGEQGCGKSTSMRVVRMQIDPHETGLRTRPHNVRDLAVAGQGTWIVAYDNLSGISDDISDALCQAATGDGALASRALYTNKGESVLRVGSPIMLNGISGAGSRQDLLDRCVSMHLRPIQGTISRMTDEQIVKRAAAIQPFVLGDLCNAAALAIKTIRRGKVPQPDDSWPRMVGAVQWAMAAMPYFGIEPADLLELWKANGVEAVDREIGDDALFAAIMRLVEDGEWMATPTDTYAKVTSIAGHPGIASGWPRSTKGMRQQLDRMAPHLRRHGVRFNGDLRMLDGKARAWRLARHAQNS